MTEMRTCPKCGETLQSDLLWGLCPKCLLTAGDSGDSDQPGPDDRGFVESQAPRPVLNLEMFRRAILDLGLLDPEEWSMFAAFGDLQNVSRLSRVLVRAGKLTNYQVAAICQGKAKGLVIGDYIVLDKLGQGGMGVVYRARHTSMGRQVALKVLHGTFVNSPDRIRRFRREITASGHLNHPNIVTAYDAGEAGGVSFLAMEFVEGEDLDRLVARRGPLPIREAVALIGQAARGLGHAHRAGIVHRDVKPRNLILASDGTVKVLDLGLARFHPDREPADRAVSAMAGFFGTATYASPEQAFRAGTVDHRTDIYSLGCTLYFLLTGRAPYEAEDAMQLLLAHHERPIPPPSAARAGVPAVLDAVHRRMQAKDPADRYQSMEEVIEALDSLDFHGVPDPGSESTVPDPLLTTAGAIALAASEEFAGADSAALVPSVSPLHTPAEARDPGGNVGRRSLRQRLAIVTLASLLGIAGLWQLTRPRGPAAGRVSSMHPIESKGIIGDHGLRRLSRIIDLERAPLLKSDEFDDPRRSVFGWGAHARKFEKGRLVMPSNTNPIWGSAGFEFSDFVCELVGKASGGRHEGWGLSIGQNFSSGDHTDYRGVEVYLNTRGEVVVAPSRFTKAPSEKISSIDPIRVNSFRAGEFNSLAVMLTGADELAIFVNDVEVCRPIRLRAPLSPAQIMIALKRGTHGSLVELERLKVWSAGLRSPRTSSK